MRESPRNTVPNCLCLAVMPSAGNFSYNLPLGGRLAFFKWSNNQASFTIRFKIFVSGLSVHFKFHLGEVPHPHTRHRGLSPANCFYIPFICFCHIIFQFLDFSSSAFGAYSPGASD